MIPRPSRKPEEGRGMIPAPTDKFTDEGAGMIPARPDTFTEEGVGMIPQPATQVAGRAAG